MEDYGRDEGTSAGCDYPFEVRTPDDAYEARILSKNLSSLGELLSLTD